MSEQEKISQLVKAVFRGWQGAGINFLVLRNYENLPDHTAKVIDVLVNLEQLQQAEEILLAAAQETGFALHNRAEFATLALYLSEKESGVQAHFDLSADLKWRGFDFLCCEEFLERKISRGLFSVLNPVDEAATNLMSSLIYTGKVKDKYKTSIVAGFRAGAAQAMQLLAKTYGPGLARRLVESATEEKWEQIEASTDALRRALVFRQMAGRPCRTGKSLGSDVMRLVKRWLRPPGLFVVLCGADGSGKSAAAPGLIEGLSSTFSPRKARHFHWKPPLFSARRMAARSPEQAPHARPQRNHLVSLLFFGFHWLEFFLGSHIRVRAVTSRGGLVLIERFYYDFFVDQWRYRLRVPRVLVRLGCRWLKEPDLVLLLDAPAELLQSRKQEVAPAETQRQREAYLQLVHGLKNGWIADAAQPPQKVVNDLNRAVLDFMRLRTNQRLGKKPGAVSTATGQPKNAF